MSYLTTKIDQPLPAKAQPCPTAATILEHFTDLGSHIDTINTDLDGLCADIEQLEKHGVKLTEVTAPA